MIRKSSKNKTRVKRHGRIRTHLSGSSERPRLTVYRSNTHIYTQIIDDVKGVTLVAASSQELSLGKNLEAAKEVGKLIAKKAVEKGIDKVVFDRSGYLYHGRIKALAESARENGLQF